MKFPSSGKLVLIAVFAGALAWTVTRVSADDTSDIKKKIADLEAGQKAILTQLQEIKLLLQARPPAPLPSGAPGAAPNAGPPPNLNAPPAFDLEVVGAPVKGRADARLAIVEFSDFQCPFCGRYVRDTFSQIERDYITPGKAKYYFRNFPLERIHPLALRASEAAECARAQGKFWEIHTKFFGNQQALTEPDLVKTAEATGLNMSGFNQCFAAQATSPARIRADQQEGLRAGISGTPTFFLGTMTKEGKVKPLRRLVGAQPFANFKTAIDSLMASPEFGK